MHRGEFESYPLEGHHQRFMEKLPIRLEEPREYTSILVKED
jgi:hypothetical protein